MRLLAQLFALHGFAPVALLPKDIFTDAGYGSEKYYIYLEQQHLVSGVQLICSFLGGSLSRLNQAITELDRPATPTRHKKWRGGPRHFISNNFLF